MIFVNEPGISVLTFGVTLKQAIMMINRDETSGPAPMRSRPAILTGISTLCVLAPASVWYLWFYSFSHQSTQADRLRMFRSYFPEFLNRGLALPFLSLGLCMIGIVLASFYWNKKSSVLKSISIVAITAGAIMVLLTVFSMM